MGFLVIETGSAQETQELARKLGERLRAGDVLVLEGELGAGKTCFTKGLALGLGLESPDLVTSPTFVLMNRYPTRIPLNHYDLYRVEGRELQALGFWDHRESGVSVIEWGEKVPHELLGPHLRIRFEITGETRRKLSFRPSGAWEEPERVEKIR